MVYVLLFPQLLLIVHAEKWCNKYGCVASFFTALILRVLRDLGFNTLGTRSSFQADRAEQLAKVAFKQCP